MFFITCEYLLLAVGMVSMVAVLLKEEGFAMVVESKKHSKIPGGRRGE